MSSRSYSENEIELIKKHFPIDGTKTLIQITNRSYWAIVKQAQKLGLHRFNYMPNNPKSKIAEIIEFYVNNNHVNIQEIALIHNLSYKKVLKYINYYLPYKGENKEIITLKSRI